MKKRMLEQMGKEMKVKRAQEDFPGGPVGKNPPCNAGNADSIPGQGPVARLLSQEGRGLGVGAKGGPR